MDPATLFIFRLTVFRDDWTCSYFTNSSIYSYEHITQLISRVYIRNPSHHLYLCVEALYVMGSLIQQAASIHGFATRHELPKLVDLLITLELLLHLPPWALLFHANSSGRWITRPELSVSNLEKQGSTPSSSRPHSWSHGCISSNPDSQISSTHLPRRRRRRRRRQYSLWWWWGWWCLHV